MPRHLLATLLLILPMTASADTLYQWHDAHGTHYSDTPPHGGYLVLHMPYSAPQPTGQATPLATAQPAPIPDVATAIRAQAMYGSHP